MATSIRLRSDVQNADRCTGTVATGILEHAGRAVYRPLWVRSGREPSCDSFYDIAIMVRLYVGLDARRNVCAIRSHIPELA